MDDDAMAPEPNDLAALRLDYEQTMVTWRMLVDIRFKLLAFVPAVTGAIVAFFGRAPSGSSAIVAAAGLGVLFGVIIYDLRNSAFHDAAVHRAKALERAMGLRVLSDKGDGSGGLMNERPGADKYRLVGVTVWHDRALYLVYSASVASLACLFTLGLLAAARVGPAWRTPIVAAVGVVVFGLSLSELHRYARKVQQPRLPGQLDDRDEVRDGEPIQPGQHR